jgi:DNA-binding response OmpR family regulator
MAPILMLTAKTDEVDKVVGLELGADDYVTKPFSMRELLARVRALLRRAEVAVPDAGVALPDDVEQLDVGDLQVDLRSRTVYRSGAKLALTLKGYELLVFLLSNRGRAFTRKDLLDRIWGYHFLGDSRTVDVHVRWLRERIEENPAKPRRLITVRGFGYRFDG